MQAKTGFEERLRRMRRAMETAKLDALVLRLPENVLLLSGYWPMIGASVLVFPREGVATCIVPACFEHEAAAELWEAKAVHFRFGLLNSPVPSEAVRGLIAEAAADKGWKRIGYEGSFGAVAPSWASGEVQVPVEKTRALYESAISDAEFVDVSALIQTERRRKTAYEIARMRLASEVSCIGLEAFQAAVDINRTGVELVGLVEHAIMTKGTGWKGATRVRAYAQVATGAAETAVAYRMHEIYTTRPLMEGEIAMLELGVVVDGYWADRTRLSVAGQPTDEQNRIFELIRKAKAAGIATVRPGGPACEVDEAARQIIRDGGYGDSFPHITGHGLGFGYHESSPILAPGSADILDEGMLMSVEPGVYFEPFGGMRLEDDVLVTDNGSEILGSFPEKLGR